MPFIAACSYCPHQLQVPDQALGASLCCPKCGNYFTVVPSESAPVTHARRPPAQPSSKPAPAAPPAAEQPWWVAATADVAVTPASPPPVLPPSPPVLLPTLPKRGFPEPPPRAPSPELPGWINTWGVVAFSLAALAMLLAAFSLPRYFSLSLAGLGLLLGLAGAVMPREEWKIKDALWLAVGGGGCSLLLLIGLLWPGLLSDRWAMDFEVPEPDPNKQFVVPRAGNAEGKELPGDERVDAATHALRQGDLLLRIDRAEVKRLAPEDPPVLLLSLHIENAGQLHIVSYQGQGGGEHPAVVRDSRGKELQRRDLGSQAYKLGQIKAASLLPLHEVKDLIAVEAPWPGTDHVDVDLPSAAWGREGACKFTVPSTFIQRQ